MSSPTEQYQPESLPIRTWGVWVVSLIVGLEALALLIIAIFFLVSLFTAEPNSLSGAVFLTVMLFALGSGLSAVSWQLFRGYRWTRAASLVWQLLMLAIAVPTLLGGQIGLGLLMLLPPLAVLFLLFTPNVVAFTLRQGNSAAL
ncbi:hypothetical protein [Psychromicrobium sp. YIM B11713]|uniref:hypothetical protein n=1 Tax=Psychromicrobium sp. YIM B11713 TaxID=3145233 RepID=UPI00374F1401